MKIKLKILFKGPFDPGQAHVLEKIVDRAYPGVPRADEFIEVSSDTSLRIDAVSWESSPIPELHFLQEKASESYSYYLSIGFRPESRTD